MMVLELTFSNAKFTTVIMVNDLFSMKWKFHAYIDHFCSDWLWCFINFLKHSA
jgi:hypothetical protein